MLTLAPGVEVFRGYKLVKPLGQGGFGEVWQAEAPGGFAVALKFIRLDTSQVEPELRALEVIRNIRHAHLLDIQFTVQVEDRLVIATPLCDRSLWDRFLECKGAGEVGIPASELLRYMEESALALDFLNDPRGGAESGRKGVAHRDVKPHNIFLVGGSVRLADFGLAKILERSVASHTGSMTPAYAAPEMFARKVSVQSDQWSLAVTYCQLRTGALPFAGSVHEIVFSIMKDDPDLSLLPLEERPAVARALEKDANDRWPSCRAFVGALKPAAAVGPDGSKRDGWEGPGPKARERALAAVRPDGESEIRIEESHEGYRSLTGEWIPEPGDSQPADRNFEKLPPPASTSGTTGEVIANSIGMKLVVIPAGAFEMGSPETEESRSNDEGPVHRVKITKPFLLGVYEVTQDEYAKVTGKSPSYFERSGRLPVETVSWYDAVNFCNLLSEKENIVPYYELSQVERDGDTIKSAMVTERNNGGYRLPTEAEWEYACRAGTKTVFHYGNALSSEQANFNGNYPYGGASKGPSLKKTTPVGSYRANAFGLYDMHGNVWEWCGDWYGAEYYGASAREDPRGPNSGTVRVLRGGSWLYLAELARAANRSRLWPGERYLYNGFRVARTRIP